MGSGFDTDQIGDDPPVRTRAAQYVRMSTDHQEYSTDNQKDAILQFADMVC